MLDIWGMEVKCIMDIWQVILHIYLLWGIDLLTSEIVKICSRKKLWKESDIFRELFVSIMGTFISKPAFLWVSIKILH